MAKIELQNVCFTYSKGTPFEIEALNNISLKINENRITGIIGHTGSGKSTLVQLFNGLAKPSSGKILLDGKDIWENPKKIGEVRYKVGLVMQYPEYQLFEETVYKDIAYAPKNMGLSDEEIDKSVKAAASFTGVTDEELEKSPFDLSGGQKRRVAIAGIMAMNPNVLILDEPAAGLDPRGRKLILGSIKEYSKKSGVTVIMVSHSMEDMAKYCDDIVVMAHAQVIMTGTKDEIFTKEDELINAGLDVPQITKLMRYLRSENIDVPYGIYTVVEAKNFLLNYKKQIG